MALLFAVMLVMMVAVAAWMLAAFVLRWRQDARCWATILVPALVAIVAISYYMGVWAPDPAITEEEVRWRRFL